MKLKKGDVYKEAKGEYWFRVIKIKDNLRGWRWSKTATIKWFDGRYGEWALISIASQIHTGKLIKIPQLYK